MFCDRGSLYNVDKKGFHVTFAWNHPSVAGAGSACISSNNVKTVTRYMKAASQLVHTSPELAARAP